MADPINLIPNEHLLSRAHNLPMADINTLTSDPYILAQLNTDLPTRHKQDPPLRLRTPTIQRSTEPVWNTDWIVAGVPPSGFKLKLRVYDEDPADHDDRLGNVHVHCNRLDEKFPGIHEQAYSIKKRMGSKRAYLVRGCAALFNRDIKMSGDVIVSVVVLGKSEGPGGLAYTVGPCAWSEHFSPLIGRLAGVKEPDKGGSGGPDKFNFPAHQMQFRGPVPWELYHRYVEFKPFVKGMFSKKGLRGRILNRALRHQHARIYNYDKSTKYGSFPEPCVEMAQLFLEFVHWDVGARMHTYVITLDGHFRFTETGKEFGIDLLSKHTMHSDVDSCKCKMNLSCSPFFFWLQFVRTDNTQT
jgi:C2 domain